MAAARRAMNGVKPMFDNPERPPLLDQVPLNVAEREDFQISTTVGIC